MFHSLIIIVSQQATNYNAACTMYLVYQMALGQWHSQRCYWFPDHRKKGKWGTDLLFHQLFVPKKRTIFIALPDNGARCLATGIIILLLFSSISQWAKFSRGVRQPSFWGPHTCRTTTIVWHLNTHPLTLTKNPSNVNFCSKNASAGPCISAPFVKLQAQWYNQYKMITGYIDTKTKHLDRKPPKPNIF